MAAKSGVSPSKSLYKTLLDRIKRHQGFVYGDVTETDLTRNNTKANIRKNLITSFCDIVLKERHHEFQASLYKPLQVSQTSAGDIVASQIRLSYSALNRA